MHHFGCSSHHCTRQAHLASNLCSSRLARLQPSRLDFLLHLSRVQSSVIFLRRGPFQSNVQYDDGPTQQGGEYGKALPIKAIRTVSWRAMYRFPPLPLLRPFYRNLFHRFNREVFPSSLSKKRMLTKDLGSLQDWMRNTMALFTRLPFLAIIVDVLLSLCRSAASVRP